MRSRPLYVFVKPPLVVLPQLIRTRAIFGIGERYGPERFHSTFLKLGETTATSIAAACRGLDAFRAAPFQVRFDWLQGNLLRPRKAVPGVRAFQRLLVRHLSHSGVSMLDYNFWLHLSLDYGEVPACDATIAPIGWEVSEILLVESVHGEGRHVVHGSWPLRSSQLSLPF